MAEIVLDKKTNELIEDIIKNKLNEKRKELNSSEAEEINVN